MNDLQNKVREFTKKYNLEHSAEISTLDLVTEIGEIAKEIIKSTDYGREKPKEREELKGEVGDAFYSLIVLANKHHINLKDALNTVLQKYEARLKDKGSAESGH